MKRTIKGFIVWEKFRHEYRQYFDGHGFGFISYAPSPDDNTARLLREHIIEFEVPDDFIPHEPDIDLIEKEVYEARERLWALELRLEKQKGKA